MPISSGFVINLDCGGLTPLFFVCDSIAKKAEKQKRRQTAAVQRLQILVGVSNAKICSLQSAILNPLRVSPGIDQRRHQGRPAGLVRCAEAGAVVAVEVLVKQQVVAPVRVVLELRGAAVDRAMAGRVAQEQAD